MLAKSSSLVVVGVLFAACLSAQAELHSNGQYAPMDHGGYEPPSYESQMHQHQHQQHQNHYGAAPAHMPPMGASYQDDVFEDIPMGSDPYGTTSSGPYGTGAASGAAHQAGVAGMNAMNGIATGTAAGAAGAANANQKGRMQKLRNDFDSVAYRVKSNPRVKQVVDKTSPKIESFRAAAMNSIEKSASRLANGIDKYRQRQASRKQQQPGSGGYDTLESGPRPMVPPSMAHQSIHHSAPMGGPHSPMEPGMVHTGNTGAHF